MINWVLRESDRGPRDAVVDRIMREVPNAYISRTDAEMDVTACHLNGCRLDFTKLLFAPLFDFAHDVYGIRRHLDRDDGTLKDCFLPRAAMCDRDFLVD